MEPDDAHLRAVAVCGTEHLIAPVMQWTDGQIDIDGMAWGYEDASFNGATN